MSTSIQIEVPIAPCPFCAETPVFKEIPYRSVGGSGMERPSVTLGCPRCDVWFPSMPGEKWEQRRGTYDVTPESKLALLVKWNSRPEKP